MIPISFARRGILLLCFLGGMAQAGCIGKWLGGSEPRVEGAEGEVPLAKVERMLDSFAERQVTLIADACESIKREARDPGMRRRAQHLKLSNGSAVYDVVTQPSALGRLADLYVLVELEYLVWVQEGWAVQNFGKEGGARLVAAGQEARHGMSGIANLALKPDRRTRLDALIRRWRVRNPDVEFITGIRFGALPEVVEKTFLESTSSFFDVINPLDDTSASVERARVLADRAFFYSKRFLKLTDWQFEASLEDTLARPEVQGLLADVDRAVASTDRISRTVQNLPEQVSKEREAILAAWDARSKELIGPVREVRSTIVEARDLAVQATEAGKAFEKTFRALHDVVGKSEPQPAAPPSRPFDIREYTAAAAEVREAAKNADGLLVTSEGFVDYLVWRVVAVIGLFFGVLLVYRLVVTRWVRPRNGPPRRTDVHRPATTWESRYGSPT
jgi:hypothetical protein